MPLVDTINNLSSDFKSVKNYKKPSILLAQFLIFSAIYLLLSFYFLDIRADLSIKLSEINFIFEIILLSGLLVSCLTSSALSFYPDFHQKYFLFKLPYLLLASLIIFYFFSKIFIGSQVVLNDLPTQSNLIQHNYHCTICIALMSVLPSIYYFAILKKGATIKPKESGAFTIIASACLGIIFLRFVEVNDDIFHILIWHFFPLLFFALIGSVIGAKFLKW